MTAFQTWFHLYSVASVLIRPIVSESFPLIALSVLDDIHFVCLQLVSCNECHVQGFPWGLGRAGGTDVRYQQAVVHLQPRQRVRRVGSRSVSQRRWKENLFLRIEGNRVEFAATWEAVELLAWEHAQKKWSTLPNMLCC